MPMQFPAFASSGRFPGGPASANFFLPLFGRNGSSARPISPLACCSSSRKIKRRFFF
ncbi:hypothetical protein [Alkalicoccus saliphilus]|uniref:hypothetical protein n=1 Tax=Alkalicoccus saliphilus TaxID=200989 RepID=UPI00135CBF73|nr:hypothetical protein [Alkalicoccus saliphilus]